MEQPTISLIIDCVILVVLCFTFAWTRRVNKSLEKLQKQMKSLGVSRQPQPAEDLTARLERLQSMKFSPMGNVVSLDKKRETK